MKCGEMSLEEKRDLLRAVCVGDFCASELQSWTRRDILEVLCSEIGQNRKYTGLSKFDLIQNLLNTISSKNKNKNVENHHPVPPKRTRKNAHPRRIPPKKISSRDSSVSGKICENFGCSSEMGENESFCRRCCCCLCQKFDESRDPSLWIVCKSDDVICSASYHLECVLKLKEVDTAPDWCFSCSFCGKVNDLME